MNSEPETGDCSSLDSLRDVSSTEFGVYPNRRSNPFPIKPSRSGINENGVAPTNPLLTEGVNADSEMLTAKQLRFLGGAFKDLSGLLLNPYNTEVYNATLPFIEEAKSYRLCIFTMTAAVLAAFEFQLEADDEVSIFCDPSTVLAGILCSLGLVLANMKEKATFGMPYLVYMTVISAQNYLSLIYLIVSKYGKGYHFEIINVVWLILFISIDVILLYITAKMIYTEWIHQCTKNSRYKEIIN